MADVTVGEAAAQTGWSARMLRYLEAAELVVPRRTGSGYRLYGLPELNQLRSLRELRARFALELTDVAFAARLRRDPELRRAVDGWFAAAAAADLGPAREQRSRASQAWVEWEQRKHERLLAA